MQETQMNKKGLVTEQDRLIIHDVEKQIDSVLQKMKVIFGKVLLLERRICEDVFPKPKRCFYWRRNNEKIVGSKTQKYSPRRFGSRNPKCRVYCIFSISSGVFEGHKWQVILG